MTSVIHVQTHRFILTGFLTPPLCLSGGITQEAEFAAVKFVKSPYSLSLVSTPPFIKPGLPYNIQVCALTLYKLYSVKNTFFSLTRCKDVKLAAGSELNAANTALQHRTVDMCLKIPVLTFVPGRFFTVSFVGAAHVF